MSSGFRDAYFGILFLPLVMISASAASDIPCTSADVKSCAPIFLPFAEPVPSAAWQPTHLDLKMVAASCARPDRGTQRRNANKVAIVNTLKSIFFISKLRLIFKVPFEFWFGATLKRKYTRKLCNIEHPCGWVVSQ